MIEFFQSDEFRTVLAALNSGFVVTLKLFAYTLIGAIPLGLIISFGSMSRWAPLGRPMRSLARRKGRKLKRLGRLLAEFRPISAVARLVVWVFRGTPLVLQILAIFYVPGMKDWFNWPSRMVAVCVAFIINYACYFSEIFRGGIQAVPVGQMEAARSLGLSRSRAMARVVLPQAMRICIPSLVNQFIISLKDTSIISVISLAEIVYQAKIYMGRTMKSFYTWTLVGIVYLILITVITIASRYVERRMEK